MATRRATRNTPHPSLPPTRRETRNTPHPSLPPIRRATRTTLNPNPHLTYQATRHTPHPSPPPVDTSDSDNSDPSNSDSEQCDEDSDQSDDDSDQSNNSSDQSDNNYDFNPEVYFNDLPPPQTYTIHLHLRSGEPLTQCRLIADLPDPEPWLHAQDDTYGMLYEIVRARALLNPDYTWRDDSSIYVQPNHQRGKHLGCYRDI
ncbi:hypothetical protein K457DRAFT_1823894 [Linnemannia elongata AG-77]|uniref:Uncharacterized protein n=1 Tax=Linnemannia elongata AG-77 TaxID=1314771 RepID=A0A197JH65_9FUNG|nr:hypothetical protein K457DRAFT_1823894 [Linnemannia elongata AG-77]